MEKLNEQKLQNTSNTTTILESKSDVRGSSLGTYTKSSSTLTKQGLRSLRYESLATARLWVICHAKAIGADRNKYKVAKCLYVPYSEIGVMRSVEHGTSHYKGLITCGSVWACPVCASKIQERRRGEIEQAIEWGNKNGMKPVMVTFTFPHTAFDKLKDMLNRQKEAFSKLRCGRPWRRLKDKIGYHALIRSLEVTHGDNGWHPHTHELWFTTSPDELSMAKEELIDLWQSACQKSGLLSDDPKQISAFRKHSVDIRQTDNVASEYMAKQDDSRKWGIADEVAKGNTKVGRKSGVHPHHFLVRKASGDEKLYLEYIDGMKGRSQIFWSKGLKNEVGVNDISDEELAEQQEDPSVLLGLLTYEDWKYVRKNDRANLLEEAEKGGWAGVMNFVESLKRRSKTNSWIDELDEDQKYLYGLID